MLLSPLNLVQWWCFVDNPSGGGGSRRDLLGQFAVLSAQFHNLLEELARRDAALFPAITIMPKKFTPDHPAASLSSCPC